MRDVSTTYYTMTLSSDKELTEGVERAYDRIKDKVHRTPVLRSRLIDEKAGCQISFKCENFQRMGAFKMRGASNAIACLDTEQKSKGVVTHSSGNMAQAVSLAALQEGIPAYIVMPENAPSVKKQAVASYGGQITEVESTIEAREQAARAIMEKTGAHFLHPSNDIDVILGQGTAAYELLQEEPNLDIMITPVGGGGLLAGSAVAARALAPNCIIMAGEPSGADDAYRSMISGKIEKNINPDTIADGLRTHLGHINFPIIQKYVDRIILVDDDEIIEAMKLIWERMKIIIEPSCAVPLAALLKQPQLFADKKVGIILSGGNVDLSKLPF